MLKRLEVEMSLLNKIKLKFGWMESSEKLDFLD